MKHQLTTTTLVFTALSAAVPVATTIPSPEVAAQWLAPAPQEKLEAGWVKDIARQLNRKHYRSIFMNAPFGSPQVSMLGLLNDAARAMKEGEIPYARDLVHHAVGLLDDGVEHGWYSRREIEPIKGMILSHAMEGIDEARKQTARKGDRKSFRDKRAGYESSEGFDESSLARSDEYDLYGEDDRWTGYTQGRQWGLTERLDRSAPASRFEDEAAYRERDRDRDRARTMRGPDQDGALRGRDGERLSPEDREEQARSSQRMRRDTGEDRGRRDRTLDDYENRNTTP